jgi:hypothetical protein
MMIVPEEARLFDCGLLDEQIHYMLGARLRQAVLARVLYIISLRV